MPAISNALLIMSLTALFAHVAKAVEPAPNTVYKENTKIDFPGIGLTFTIPTGWHGSLSANGEGFVMESLTADANLVALAQPLSETELRDTLRHPIMLFDSLQLQPLGKLSQNNGEFYNEYSVANLPKLSAFVRAKAHKNVASAFFLLAPSDGMQPYLGALQSVSDSLRTIDMDKAADTAQGNSSQNKDNWQAYLKGKHLVRYYTGAGYTEEQHLWLCSDGRFARKFDSGGFGGGASGAFSGRYGGRWRAQGSGEHGLLNLQFNTGDDSEYTLRWDYENSRLYLDGKRWLHDSNQLCQ